MRLHQPVESSLLPIVSMFPGRAGRALILYSVRSQLVAVCIWIRIQAISGYGQAVFYGDLNQEDLEVFLFQIEKSMFYGQLNQED